MSRHTFVASAILTAAQLNQTFDWAAYEAHGGKPAVRVATTANGTLATAFDDGSVVDDITLATGDLILLKNQTDGTANGAYIVAASGAPTRATWMDADAEVVNGASIFVKEGTANGGKTFDLTNTGIILIGTTSLTFTASLTNPMTTSGDLIVGGASGAPTRLPVNATGTRQFVRSVSGGTALDTLVAGDIPNIAESQVTNLTTDLASKAPLSSPALTDVPTAPTASPGTNNTQIATTAYADAAAAALVDSAPGTLNTLNELAAALGDDANFAATTATALGTKAIGVGSSTDEAIARFDGTGGKQLQDSAVTVSDAGAVTVPEIAAPSTPASGKVVIYAKTDGKVYSKDDAGTETELGGAGGASAFTDLTDAPADYTGAMDKLLAVNPTGTAIIFLDLLEAILNAVSIIFTDNEFGTWAPAGAGDLGMQYVPAAPTIADDSITYAKIQNVSAASKLLGRGDSGAGSPEEITLGTGLAMSGTTLNASLTNTFCGVSLNISSGAVASGSSYSQIDWSDEEWDTDGFYSGGAASRITIPSGKAGKYLAIARATFAANATGNRLLCFELNGSSLLLSEAAFNAQGGSLKTTLSITHVFDLDVADYLEVFSAQTSGGSLDINIAEFQLTKIG